jgi:hypothetical protein
MNNKKINKKINFLLKEDVPLPEIGAPGGPISPYPHDGYGGLSNDDIVRGIEELPWLHPLADPLVLPQFFPYLDPFLSPFGDRNPPNGTPQNPDGGEDMEEEDDEGFQVTPGFPPPNRIPPNLIPNIPQQPAPGWENYFQAPPGSGQWWYCPYGSPNNPNRVPSGITPHNYPGILPSNWGTNVFPKPQRNRL